MRYAIIIEKGPEGYGAYVPDLPGCVAVGESREEVMRLIQEAIEFHIEGQHVPEPTSLVEFIDVAA
jgi:predicted RNase H-like HicB family nuclease